MVEVGYRIVPAHRRRGYARAALSGLLDFAREQGARTARASIAPGNVASLALAASFGFVRTGEQWDEIDGRELVFERPLT
jgi:RimJ/RimL family protein N-acetyltransferase